MTGTDHEEACRREAKVAADRTERNFEQLKTRLEELALMHEDDEAQDAWESVEDLAHDFEDAIDEAREAIQDE